MTRLFRRLRRGIKRASGALVGAFAIGVLKMVRAVDPDKMADFTGWMMSRIGPLLPESRIGRANLAVAFPEKSQAEIDIILRGCWDNLGRMGAEFAHLDRLWSYDREQPTRGRIDLAQPDIERFHKLLDDGKPALIFAAHLANWELPAICAATYNLDSAVLYRRPNISRIDRWLTETRTAHMGELISTDLDAPMKIADALQRGAHVGILVDQYYSRGVPVAFFGRQTLANPLLARLAQHFDCPIHGTRIIRLENHRFRAELTDEIKPARDANGKIDIAGTMQIITSVVEQWIRQCPEQWLWMHRRWRQ
ncbi:MAG: lipid A biosynthesis lauroyl acyltransferase [Pseudolabrys sp.]|jgi:KDO2-lipid IV(A) lauroyltransferase|nr:lipid A biosynthesis lauroyl acyltransferase [Pseudolabrys sp.]